MNTSTPLEAVPSPQHSRTPLTLGETVAQLAAAGYTQPLADHPLPAELAPVHDAESSPWYVKLLVGIAAWISALFLGMFFAAAGLIDDWQTMFIWGSIVSATALATKWLARHSIFWGQLAFALILAGQGLLLVGTGVRTEDPTMVALVAIGLELLLFVLYPDTLHRMLSLLAIVGALLFLAYDQELTNYLSVLVGLCALGTVVAWQAEYRLVAGRLHPFRVPLTYGFALALFGTCLLPLFAITEMIIWWPATAILALLLLYVAHQVLRELDITLGSAVGLWVLVAVALLLIPAYETPGILAALLVLILSWWRSNGLMSGLAAAFLLFFLSVYYYNLDLTLDEKSYILAGTGVVLLAARVALHRIIGAPATEAEAEREASR